MHSLPAQANAPFEGIPMISNEIPYYGDAFTSNDLLQLLIQKKSEEVALLQEAFEATRRDTSKGEEPPSRLPPIFEGPAKGRAMTLPPPGKRKAMEPCWSPFVQPVESPYSSASSSPYVSPVRNEPLSFPSMERRRMEKFPINERSDFKHVVYNLLVDSYNHPEDPEYNFIRHYEVEKEGQARRSGFRFVNEEVADRKLAEMYCLHAKKVHLHHHSLENVLVQDLYKFYLRSCLELLAKYFEKSKEDKYTFLYADGQVLFVPGGSLDQAAKRIRNMKTRARRTSEKSPARKPKQPRRK